MLPPQRILSSGQGGHGLPRAQRQALRGASFGPRLSPCGRESPLGENLPPSHQLTPTLTLTLTLTPTLTNE